MFLAYYRYCKYTGGVQAYVVVYKKWQRAVSYV